jgi:hypothetical protein
MKSLNENFTKIANQIEYQIQQYEQATKLNTRKAILDELKVLQKNLEDNVW